MGGLFATREFAVRWAEERREAFEKRMSDQRNADRATANSGVDEDDGGSGESPRKFFPSLTET
jgi:hypothetical protein